MANSVTYKELKKLYHLSIVNGSLEQAPDDLIVPGYIVSQIRKITLKKPKQTLM